MDRLYMVVALHEIDSDERFPEAWRLPSNRRPSVLWWHRLDAEREAERLALKTGGAFGVMELVAEVKPGGVTPPPLPLMRAPAWVRSESTEGGE